MKQMEPVMVATKVQWELDSLVSTILGKKRNPDQAKLQISQALVNTTNHEVALSTRERVTRFIRSTVKSDLIAHNERIKQTLESIAKCKYQFMYT